MLSRSVMTLSSRIMICCCRSANAYAFSTIALFRPMAVCSNDRIAAAPTEAWVRRDASGLFKPP
jgi:hypothetical protein